MKSNVCMDMIKLFKAPRSKKLPLNYHIICIISAYYHNIEAAFNLDKPIPLIDIISRNAIYVSYSDTHKMKHMIKIRCIEGWEDNDYS